MDYEKKYKEALEDEKIYTFVYDFFENCWWNTNWEISREQALKMLKSLRPVSKESLQSWKPSEEPNIELIQRSWYMEGYHDCEFGYEPRWVIKTGEGGPRYEENPKYGQHIEKQDYSGLNDLEQAIHRGFLVAGVVNVPVNIIKETAQDCLAHLPVEWSEDFDKEVENVHKRYPEVSFAKLTRIAYHFSKWANRRKDMEWREQSEKRK